MIRYVKLHNYKSLKDFTVDFTKTKDNPKDLILIYGENGAGKSNFVNSFFTLRQLMHTRYNFDKLQKMIEEIKENDFLKDKGLQEEIVTDIIKKNLTDTKSIIDDSKTISSKGNMILEYGFQINGKNGMYKIEIDDEKIVSETLEYIFKKNKSYYFNLNSDSIMEQNKGINSKVFVDKKYEIEFYRLLDKYWGKDSLMSILFYEFKDKKDGYVQERIDSGLTEVLEYLTTMCTKIKGSSDFGGYSTRYLMLGRNPIKGKINIKQSHLLDDAEKLFSTFFTTLYSDVKSVYYKQEIRKNVVEYNLIFKKLIYDEILDIPFESESTGTENLLDILPFFISVCDGQTVIIDEIDTGIHDVLMNDVINSLSDNIKGQLIATTHNTMLLESDEIDKESIYILNVDKNGYRELFPITDFERVQENNNARKRYLNGLYGGVPSSGNLNFEDLMNSLKLE